MRCDRKSLFFQWALPRRAARIESISILAARRGDVESTLCILSVDRKREVSKFNVGVVLIIAIHEISNRENEFDVNSRNIHSSKITRYTVYDSTNAQNFIS